VSERIEAMHWKLGVGLAVVAFVGAGVGYGFKVNHDLRESRTRIDDLERAVEVAKDSRLSDLEQSQRRYRDLEREMASRVAHARDRASRLYGLLRRAVCFNDLRPLRKGFFSGTRLGDVDGDGLDDGVQTFGRPTRHSDCRYLLRVRTDGGRFQARVHHDAYGLEHYLNLLMLVDINGVPGDEIVVAVDQGAYAQIAQIFTLSPGYLTRIKGFGSRDLWISGASAGNGAVFGCLDPDGGTVFRTVWGYAGDGKRHDITRRFYRVEGDRATLYFRERHTMVLTKAFDRFPEFDDSDGRFGRCS